METGIHKSKSRKKLFIIVTAIFLLFIFYRFLLLPYIVSWGATQQEYSKQLYGDELIEHKNYKNTLAVAVHAPPSKVWPWIAQMGLHKGGFYSYTFLENLFGCQLKNANTIQTQWQNVQVGDFEPVCKSQEGKPNAGWRIAVVKEREALVWQGLNGAEWMMGVYIDSIDANTSRLITRQQFVYPKKWTVDWWLEKLWFEWAHCIMQHGMINGIKTRAEGLQAKVASNYGTTD
jgi:hypothetical protein